jgi:hypothetical protein
VICLKKSIELEIHDDYYKALEDLFKIVNLKHGVQTIDQLVSVIVRNHVMDDLKDIIKE